MNYLDWKAGDKVVCTDGHPGTWWHRPIRKGEVYTIRSMYVWEGTTGVALTEAANLVNPSNGLEYGYEASRFRKVEPRKTDISIFTAMLNRTKVDA